jgi:hypothetical protein
MSLTEHKTLSCSLRCYRALLRVYPRAFRDEFEALLCQAFGDLSLRVLRSRGRLGWLGLWWRTLSDLLASAIDHRLGNTLDRRLGLRWILACAIGLPLGALLVFVDLYSIRFVSRVLSLGVAWGLKRGDPTVFVPVVAFVISLPLGLLQSLALGWKRTARLAWVAATVLGVAIGWTAMYSVLSESHLWTTVTAYRQFVHPAGFLLCGSIMGLFQMAVLAHKTAKAWAWVPASAFAMLALGYSIEMVPMFLPPIVGGAIFGIVTAGPLKWIVQSRSSIKEMDLGDVREN